MHYQANKQACAFSLIEIFIGLLVISILVAGAYRLLVGSSRRASESAAGIRNLRNVEQFLDQVRFEIANAIPIDDGAVPLQYNQSPSGERYPSAIVAFPGYSVDRFDSSLSAFDPSTVDLSGKVVDAIRIVNLAPESVPVPLYIDSGTGLPEATNGSTKRIRVAEQTGFDSF